MKSIVICGAVRTAIGRMGGAMKNVPAEKLTEIVINETLARAAEGGDVERLRASVDEVIIGQAKQSTDAPNIARVAALMAGLDYTIPAYTVHRQCGSGLQAILSAAQQIESEYGEVIVVGGVESMSTAPYYLRNARYGYNAGNGELVDPNTESQPKSQPEDIYGHFTMGMTAENVAEKYGISREEQDLFAYGSQQKAVAAIDGGIFSEEITAVPLKVKKSVVDFTVDEFPRRDTSLEKMALLPPVFKEGGTVTAGNASGRNDGAAAVVVTTEEKARELGLKPQVRLVAAGVGGVDPRLMGLGPVPASRKALKRAGLGLKDMGAIEINEAFAAQTLGVMKELNVDPAMVNFYGGGIALGHPLGCSGARISVTLFNAMRRHKARYGLATLCIAGGLGLAAVYENLS